MNTRGPNSLSAPRCVFQLAAALGISFTLAASLHVRAGDILRGGSPAGARRGVAGSSATPVTTAKARSDARDTLARTTQAVQAVKAMQASARDAAVRGANNLGKNLPNVPNGLGPGGLKVAPGVPVNLARPAAGENRGLWQGAQLPMQRTTGGETIVTIKQTRQQALLNWETFNIGKSTTLSFDQSAGGDNQGQWIAFNKINDPSGVPSQILGSIEASGQVYIINPNGIIFGGSSQINLHTLVASGLRINENLISRGLLNNPDAQFLFSSLPLAAGSNGTPAFNPTINEPAFRVNAAAPTHKVTQFVATDGKTPASPLRLTVQAGASTTLAPTVDYTLSTDAADGRTIVTFTEVGLGKVNGAAVRIAYTPLAVPSGDVVVQRGATISAPTTPEHVGGRVALIGANVTNDGTISTPDGQTILAAGLQVGLAAHDSKDPSLRGLDVYVGKVRAPAPAPQIAAGTVTNTGLIDAPRANVTLAGRTVNHSGAITSSTSVSLNGRVDLLAEYNATSNPQTGTATVSAPFLLNATGSVNLGAGSVTQILPELESVETVVGTTLALRSEINVRGRVLHLGKDSTILAPSADVSLSAGVWLPISSTENRFVFANNGNAAQRSQIYLEAGAMIDVAGSTDILAPLTENILALEVRGAEVADAPLQRDGVIRGLTLQIDARKTGFFNGRFWIGTPLADASGYVGLIERSVGELTAMGGTVTLSAGDSVVLQRGSSLDVSGGSVIFEGGMVQTTRLLAGGQLIDIAQATPDRIYDGIYTGTATFEHPKYGASETFTNPLALTGAHFEAGYTAGASGGTIAITAPAMALDGMLRGQTIAGPRQQTAPPTPSTLTLAFRGQDASNNAFRENPPATPPRVVFAADTTQEPAAALAVDDAGTPELLREERQKTVTLSPELLSEQSGFGILRIDNVDGDIAVPTGLALRAPAGGSITLNGANVDIQAEVSAPGGTLSFTSNTLSPYRVAVLTSTTGAIPAVPEADPERGNFTLGAGASLSTAGLIVDERPEALRAGQMPMVIDGGRITIRSYRAEFSVGSTIDVSGGVAVSSSGRRTYGRGGAIDIQAGREPNEAFLDFNGGTLALGATLRGMSGGAGGSLSILAPSVQIGGRRAHADTLLLTPAFFSEGGFTNFALRGLGAATEEAFEFIPGIAIAAGTVIEPVAQNWLADVRPADGSGVALRPTLLPQALRTPVSLNFEAIGVSGLLSEAGQVSTRGDFVMEKGAIIRTEPAASVAIKGETSLVLGSVFAPGGAISVGGARGVRSGAALFADVSQAVATVVLGSGSVLSTAGGVVLTPNAFGNRTGNVLAGGSITVSGNVVAERGAVLDVSGTSARLDVAPSILDLNPGLLVPANSGLTAPVFGSLAVETRMESNAGAISLSGSEMLFTDATLRGAAGGETALGGSLSVSSGRFSTGATLTPLDFTLVVTQDQRTLPASVNSSGQELIGRSIPTGERERGADGTVAAVLGRGHFAVSSFSGGGFAALTLGGSVKFAGPIAINAPRELTIAGAGVISANSAVHLAAPRVTLGMPFQAPFSPLDPQTPFTLGGSAAFNFSPSFGPGSLTVAAQLIDVGNLSLQNTGKANFLADGGEIRGDGTFDVAGDIYLRAAQIYPPTAVRFTIAASDHQAGTRIIPGSVTIARSGVLDLPMSAGGQLNVFGSIIRQGGMLVAPLGSINLGYDGTGVAPQDLITGQSVAVTQRLTLAAGSVTSVAGIDPNSGREVLIPYGVNLNGVSWIDPAGTDITAGGGPAKAINLEGVNIADQGGSLVDIRGGGDLFAYRFVSGIGGTMDVLASTSSFAVMPGYQSDYAPFATNNPRPSGANLGGDPGYVNSTLAVGDQVQLGASEGWPAGTYTLLPARYALLPGAFLITPRSGAAVGSFQMPDGSSLVSGYRFNGLNDARTVLPLATRFEIAPGAVVRSRSEFENYTANSFLAAGAEKNHAAVPRLPVDAGHLILQATRTMSLQGRVLAQAPDGARGGLVDIASPSDILIGDATTKATPGVLTLDAAQLSSFGAESLLIGGVRQLGAGGSIVTVKTGNVTVDNAGTPLTGSDVILVANEKLTLAPGAEVAQSGTLVGPAETLRLTGEIALGAVGESFTVGRGGGAITFPEGTPGDNFLTATTSGTITRADGTTLPLAADTPFTLGAGSVVRLDTGGSLSFASGTGGAIPIALGDGTLLRVSSDPGAQIVRTTLSGSSAAGMIVGAGARISGAGLILDSTNATTLAPTAALLGKSISLNSGQISVQLADPGALQPTVGLVLAGSALASLQGAQALSLLSYSTIDLYGTGAFRVSGNLALHAAQIRGFNNDGKISLNAGSITLDNSPAGRALDPLAALAGTLEFNAATVRLGVNQLSIEGFANLNLNAARQIFLQSEGGLSTQGALLATTPLITGERIAEQQITAGGALLVRAPEGAPRVTASAGGLGAMLTLQGASVTASSDIVLPSGALTLHATTGDVLVNGRLDVGGTEQSFYDLVKYTSGGEIRLISDSGAITVASGGRLNVAANAGGGDAGRIAIQAAEGEVRIAGTLSGRGGAGGTGGSFSLDVRELPRLAGLSALLDQGAFTEAQSFRIRTGDVLIDGVTEARAFDLSADQGGIMVSGTIDASGVTGGTIALHAAGSFTLTNEARLSVAAREFDAAGKGGVISLAAGSQTNGAIDANAVLDLQAGSVLDLAVASSAGFGDFTGTLHLRAPQTAGGADVRMNAIGSTIRGASRIVVEGYELFTPAGGDIDSVIENVRASGATFTANTNAIATRLLAGNAELAAALQVRPGAEIINPTGDLTLSHDWDLSTFRFGPTRVIGTDGDGNPITVATEPGVLTIRAAGDLIFNGALSDGFDPSQASSLWLAPLMIAGSESWSYRLTAGADLAAADFHRVQPLASLAAGRGSLRLGVDGGRNTAPRPGPPATTASAIAGRFQVIRTGTGDIDISTGRDVQLLNQFATIYTAGAQVADPTLGGTFNTPEIDYQGQTAGGLLGAVQQRYPAQYSFAGGDVTIAAQGDIERLTMVNDALVADSSKELPVNWLYRRGSVDSATGLFANTIRSGRVGEVASTTWWVDFSNFFEGVGALGGGNVTMTAGANISNVDAAVPTNARMPGLNASGANIAPDASRLLELGGGDLLVRAGRDIDGGAYYVERGHGTLTAGDSIRTNATRSPSLTLITGAAPLTPETWLPTTLFVGKGGFDVSARGDLLLGPVANPFLLPAGVGNPFWQRTYFSTLSANAAVNVASLGGDVTLRSSVFFNDTNSTPMLQSWLQRVLLLPQDGATNTATFQPWLRLNVTSVEAFRNVAGIMPPTLRATAFAGGIDLAGSLTLFPSPTATIELAAAGAISGLQPLGTNLASDGRTVKVWGASTINLSDANPSAVPGVATPIAYTAPLTAAGVPSTVPSQVIPTGSGFLQSIERLFAESGATSGENAVLQTQQALHAPGPLHAGDREPIRLYAEGGDISGLTLFSGKAARVIAGRDITDIAFYVQNVDANDISLVAAGRDIVAYNPNSTLRAAAQAAGNALTTEPSGLPQVGDFQISGPGTLELLAGGNFDLGVGPNNSDGTALGVTSVGNARNPFLPFEGANLIVGAGLGASAGLSQSQLDVNAFTEKFLDPGSLESERYLPELGELLSARGFGEAAGNEEIASIFAALPSEQRAGLALEILYLVLRDAGRDHNDSASAGFGTYAAGFDAIQTLFPKTTGAGDILLTSRQIKTANGGDISLFAPGGSLTVGFDIAGNQPVDQGILTESGGNISIFTEGDVIVGTSRIFVLRGGNEIIWSSEGDIAAGAASKTVQSAPPTRVLVDPQSGNVETDLAGLATGGGIGVLDTVAGIAPGDIDLIAPGGAIDAGDAGIRSSGNLNLAAVQVLNASNIQVAGNTAGAPPAPVVAVPNIAGLAAASTAAGAGANAAEEAAKQARTQATEQEEVESIIVVEVVGYGGGEG